MNAAQAAVRLWVVASTFWIALLLLNYVAKCVHGANGSLLCPVANGTAFVDTNYLNLAYLVLGPPLASLVIGLACWLMVLGVRHWLGQK